MQAIPRGQVQSLPSFCFFSQTDSPSGYFPALRFPYFLWDSGSMGSKEGGLKPAASVTDSFSRETRGAHRQCIAQDDTAFEGAADRDCLFLGRSAG